MSGGAFNYLCFVAAEDLPQRKNDLKAMAAALTEAGATQAAAETEAVLAYIEHAERQITARQDRLSDVWRAMEWVKSGDSTPDRLAEAVAAYNAE